MAEAARGGPAETRPDYAHFLPIQTRWNDNDMYGHVNNVVFYGWFDTVVNDYLIRMGGLDPVRSDVIGIVPESGCRYHRPVSFPGVIQAGLRVAHLGRSSVRYEIAIFEEADDAPAASGFFVHVFVTRETMRPAPMPESIRAALSKLQNAPE